MHPLVEEAMRKAAVAWLTVPGAPAPYPVWCRWLDDAAYLVSGPGEQPAPGLAAAGDPGAKAGPVLVTVRGDHGGSIVTWPARAHRVDPRGEEWARVAPQLATRRLNAPRDAAETTRRWAAECLLTRLTPAGDPMPANR